jgi:TonB family protein
MHTHADVFDRPDRVARFFWGSIGLHLSILVAALVYTIAPGRKPVMGDIHGGGMGAVSVTTVHTIPLPSKNAPTNPLANPTESAVPTPPPVKTKPQVEKKLPNPKAIPIPDKHAPPKLAAPDRPAPNKARLLQPDRPNQVYSNVGQALSSPMYQKQGAGGVNIGNDNPLGQQYGEYAKMIIDQVGRHWNTAQLGMSTAPLAIITFTINRDGSVPQDSVRVAQSSGIPALDRSAQRAVLDAAPFQRLPAGFTRNDAQIELRFELRR